MTEQTPDAPTSTGPAATAVHDAYVDALAVLGDAFARVRASTGPAHLEAGAALPRVTTEQQRDGLAYQEAHADYEHKRDAYYRAAGGPQTA